MGPRDENVGSHLGVQDDTKEEKLVKVGDGLLHRKLAEVGGRAFISARRAISKSFPCAYH